MCRGIAGVCGSCHCGTVLGQATEARALPAAIAAHGSAEWDYVTTCIALAAALGPQPHDPLPTHHNAAGASLACTSAVFSAVDSLPVMQMGEDRAFAETVAAHDFRLRYSGGVIVETSCRMGGADRRRHGRCPARPRHRSRPIGR